MTIDLTCQKCEGSFELDVAELVEGSEKLVCPNCDAKAPTDLTEDFVAALGELVLQVKNLSKRFTVALSVETDEVIGETEDEDDDEGADEDAADDDVDDEGDEDADDEDDDDFEGEEDADV